MSNISIKLQKRRETSRQWDINQMIEAAIAVAFSKSIGEFDEETAKNSEDIVIDIPKMLWSEDYKDVDYGGKTLGEAGCGAFCFEHGLHFRFGTPAMPMADLAKYLADLGYYEYGKGTYHNLFDHYGLRRATHVNEVLNALDCSKIVTVLVRNCDYSKIEKKEGSHFVNLIGKKGANFIVADPSLPEPVEVSMKEIFKATRISWIW